MTTQNVPEFNYAEVAAQVVAEHREALLRGAAKIGEKLADEFLFRFTNVFSDYLARGATSYSRTKTILYRNEPMPLYSFYEPLDLKRGTRTIKCAGIAAVAKIGRLVIVSGLAGTGKSTFLKHLFLDAIRTSFSIPIFLELRRMNTLDLDLVELLGETIRFDKTGLSKEYLDKSLASGQFTLLLDAYDELKLDRKESIRSAIFRLTSNYPNLRIILTSRPDNEFVGWSSFVECQAMKLSKQQALSLIDKLTYDPDVKQRFIHELDRTLYKEHESFLSNPLLLTIMLMTYRENAEIPQKRHLFFAQVFHTLYSQHDALKEGYKRELFTGLAMDDFQKVLAAFSIQSYLHGEVTFSREGALKYLAKAKELTNLAFGIEEYLDDLLRSVCIFVQDGLFYSYTHKQFQEYYTASFIVTSPQSKRRKLVAKVAPGSSPNDVIRILFDMAPDLTERTFILPAIKKLLKATRFEGTVDEAHHLRAFNYVFSFITVWEESRVVPHYGLNNAWAYQLIRFVISVYAPLVSRKAPTAPVAAISDYVFKKYKTPNRSIVHVKTQQISDDPALLRLVRKTGLLTIDDLKYLVDVRDFVTMRLKRSADSLDDILS